MENENQNVNEEPNRFDEQPVQTETQQTYEQPVQSEPLQQSGEYYGQGVQNEEPEEEKAKHFGLGLAALILGIFSLLCCWGFGIGIVFGLIAGILGLIALLKGTKSGKVLGGIGMGLGILGMILGIIVLVSVITAINWDNFTMQNLETYKYIDATDQDQVKQWMQQFFNRPIY